jgi:hypothetical protein
MDENGLTKGIVVPSYCPIYSPYMLSFCNAASFEEEGKDGGLRQVSFVHEHDEAVNSADQVGHTGPSQTAKAQFPECGKETGKEYHVPSLTNSTALPDFGKVHVRDPDIRTVHDLWQEYAHGLNGQEPWREKERRGTKWRHDPIDPKTGKRGHKLMHFWSKRLPIYLFIEMRVGMGDSEAVAVETCQEIVNNYMTKNGSPNWRVVSPLLRGVRDQEKDAVTTCQQIFNKYLTRNGRPISEIVGDQVQNPSRTTVEGAARPFHVSDRRTVRDIWQEYAHGLKGQEPLCERERRGIEWRLDPIDPKTGKRGSTLTALWSKLRPIYLFIEMRIAMGDSEGVAVEICQEIVNNYPTRNGSLNWRVVSPLLKCVVRQEKDAVTTCQQIFNTYLTKNGRPISEIVSDQVQNPSRTTVEGAVRHFHVSDRRTVHDIWQEYAHGLNGQEPLREKERARGSKWRRGPIDPKTGRQGQELNYFWSRLRPIYLFIEMRIAMGDSEAVAVETCQEIVNNYLTRSGFPNWRIVSPLLRGVLDQEKNAVTTCQQIFNKYLTRNGRLIVELVGDQVQNPSRTAVEGTVMHFHVSHKRTVHDIWQEYAHGLNGQEPLREKERARGSKWRRCPIDPKTGKPGQALNYCWTRRLPIYLFIEMRIDMGDSEAVAVETCQEIVNNYMTKNGSPNWKVVSPLLRGVLDQEKDALTTCQQICNKNLSRNGRPTSGIVDLLPHQR